MKRLVSVFLSLLVYGVAMNFAQSEDKTSLGVQNAIEDQLLAFREKDFQKAYSYAAPNVKNIFPTQQRFIAMVDKGYQPIFQSQQFSFGSLQRLDDGQIVQEVVLLGPRGKTYDAIYRLKLQPDGVFRITGVIIKESKAAIM